MKAFKNKAQELFGSHHQGKTVLITGASGFVATHVVKVFLGHGYHVRGTVRSEQTAENVRRTFPQHGDKLSFVIVKDIAAPGAFDEAVKGVDGIIHTASPFQMNVEDNERDLLVPAVNGTRSILQAAQAHAPRVHRIVITSSFASVVDLNRGTWPEKTYTEADWNPETYEQAKTADGATAYSASKAFAEKAAFDFVAAEKPHFAVATLCPPMIYGPVEHHVTDLAKLNTSAADIYRLMDGSTSEVPETAFFAFVDVRDVAEAHLRAFESPRAAGERFLIASDSFDYQHLCDALRAEVPEVRDKVPLGQPGAPLPPVYKVSNEKARSVLGMSFRPLSETVKDTAYSLLDLEKKLKA